MVTTRVFCRCPRAATPPLLQICYNVPVLPLLLAQLSLDARYDLKFSSRVTYTVRICVALTVLLICLLTVPHVGQSGERLWRPGGRAALAAPEHKRRRDDTAFASQLLLLLCRAARHLRPRRHL